MIWAEQLKQPAQIPGVAERYMAITMFSVVVGVVMVALFGSVHAEAERAAGFDSVFIGGNGTNKNDLLTRTAYPCGHTISISSDKVNHQ